MLGRQPISTAPLVTQDNVFNGVDIAFVVRDLSGPQFVAFDRSSPVVLQRGQD